MEKRIELERRARKLDQITHLNLDNCRSTSIVGLTDEYTALESLSLINVGLTTLKGFPKLPNLTKLELSDNRISNGLNYLTTCPRIQSLSLSGNRIDNIEILKPLEELKNLFTLDLFFNDITEIENYREKIFKMLPSLDILDGFDRNGEEVRSEDEDAEEVNGNDSEDGVSGEDDDDESDESYGDVSLSEVYNDDLEEDKTDWEGEGGEEEDEEDFDIDEYDGEANESAASVNANEKEEEKTEESHARGKKRKHDG